ncbi:uncharacterized protein IUM83_18538 [Phytophthora cinnamomi]|uniref:uncharacterized protein n=1 Tax=Phytophthora cinnamomi TaxID=4785 RepID=UPI0035597079|nr:hypothetical protein IUM83_18538 [Phytophthora cinnamomi]
MKDALAASLHATRTDNNKKKRVRRIQKELPLWRQQVAELELQLARCKLKRRHENGDSKEMGPHKKGHKICDDSLSVWNNIAERQLRERLRVEQQQLKLEKSCSEAARVSLELHKLMHKFEESKQAIVERCRFNTRQQHFWDLSVISDHEIFSDQLSTVARLHLESQQQHSQSPSGTSHFGCGLSMGRDVAKADSKVKVGVVLEARCGTVLPFPLNVAVDAYWRFFSFGYIDKSVVDHVPELKTDTLTRSFTARMRLEDATSVAGGSFTKAAG